MTIISKQNNSELKFNLSFYGNGNILISSYDADSDTYSDFKPITEETFETLNKFFKKKINQKKYFIKGMIPRNIHYFDIESLHVIWTTEEKQTEQLFTDDKIENGIYPVPKLLWKFYKGSLSVYAYKIEKGNIVLYNAPFLNTSLGGAVFGGKIGSDLGGSIANDLTDGDKTITALGNITGETVSDEVVREIFAKFCLGK